MTAIKTFLSIALPIVWGLTQWRIQFVEKSRHEAGTQFLEKLDLLISSIQNYRRPGDIIVDEHNNFINKDERKMLENKKEIVNQAYNDANRALVKLETIIPGRETKKLANLYRNLITERIIRKLYGIHYVYLHSTAEDKEHHQEWLQIIYRSFLPDLSKYYTVIHEQVRPSNEKMLNNLGTIYAYTKGKRWFYSFKERVFNKEILEGQLGLQDEEGDIAEGLNNFNESIKDMITEQATTDIFGQIINKYFLDITSQCRKDFFINSWLLPIWKWTKGMPVLLIKKICCQ